MKKVLYAFFSCLLLFTFQSCIQDEPLNAECDILGLSEEWVEANKELLIGKPIVTNEAVTVYTYDGTDRTSLAPVFILTEGARITAVIDGKEVDGNGIVRDFNQPQHYRVTSQDGRWSKDYEVSFKLVCRLEKMSFDHYELNSTGKFYQWYEKVDGDKVDPRRDYWASGNLGYNMCGMAKSPEDYPSAPYSDGVVGSCVKLVTRDTGFFGMALSNKMPIAAGNVFIGTFDSKIATKQPRQATAFGLQLVGPTRPLTFEGWYKYTAGSVFTNVMKQPVEGKRDMADIYAVVYEADPENFAALDGDVVLSSERIVMMARIADPGEPATWTRFEEPFVMKPGKTFDEARAKNNGYAVAVVITSSRDGAYFEGAIGSTLYVDELEIKYDDKKVE